MKNYLTLFLLVFIFAGYAKAQPASTANWYGYILPPSPAANMYVSFTMQDLGEVSTNEHLKSFNPASPSSMEDHGAIEHDGFNLAINMDGDAYMISSWGEFGLLDLSNAQLSVVNSIDLPIKMAFDMSTGELFGVHYGNVYQLDPNTGVYTLLGALQDGNDSYDPTCLFMAYGSNPSEFTVGDLNYRVNEDNASVTVTGHVDGYNAVGPLVIPESVSYGGRDYAVTVIGNTAFIYCYYLTSLTIPNSVTTIEEGAFAYCSGFTGDLVIPNSVVTIEPSAFHTCYAFDGKLLLGDGVTSIGDWAFNSCDGLTGVLNISSNVASIGEDAFGYCKFDGIVVDPENSVYDSREDCNAIIITSTNELIKGCKNTIIPTTVTAIGDNSFKGIGGLASITIPNSVKSIGNNAFATCPDLTGDLVIPNSVETIGESAFFQCVNLNGTLTIGESVNYIGDWAFRKCSNVSEAVSLATTPAVLGDELGGMVFGEFGTQTLTVPCGCVEVYQNSQWYDPFGLNGFYEFVEDCSLVSDVDATVPAVYPNPTSGKVSLEVEDIQSISIFNILGEKVFECYAKGDVFEYDFGQQKAGVYFIKVETTNGAETVKVTVR